MRQSKILLDSSAIQHNIQLIKNHAQNSEIIPVLKANAYGHGIDFYLKFYEELGFNRIAVAYLEEAEDLREKGFKGKILVLVPPTIGDLEDIIRLDLECSIDSFDLLDAISNQDFIIDLHLFVNTGMNRDGINIDRVEEFLEKAKRIESADIVGIMTHFADAEKCQNSFAKKQYEIFENLVKKLQENSHIFNLIHAQNSSGIFNLDCPICNAIRPGISLHGLLPNPNKAKEIGLKPVLELNSRVKNTYELKAGDTAGYSFKFIAQKDTRVAVIPIGYGDGLNTRLGNKAECLIKGKRYPIVGSVCMDLTLIDIGFDNVGIGDEVTLIGKSGNDEISVYEYADILELIPYEITTALKRRVERKLIFKS